MQDKKADLGKYLRTVRLEKGLSLEDAARETNISKKYLEALEANQFHFLPAETYLLGFLSTYGDLLGLEEGSLFAMYQKQTAYDTKDASMDTERLEQAMPFSTGTVFKRVAQGVFILLVLGAFVLGGVALFQWTQAQFDRAEVVYRYNMVSYTNIANQLFQKGDVIEIQSETGIIHIKLERIRLSKQWLRFRFNQNEYQLEPGDTLSFDVSGDGENDFMLKLSQLSEEGIRLEAYFFALDYKEERILESLGSSYVGSVFWRDEILQAKNPSNFSILIESRGVAMVLYRSDSSELQALSLSTGQSTNLSALHFLEIQSVNSGVLRVSVGNQTLPMDYNTSGTESRFEKTGIAKNIFLWNDQGSSFQLLRLQVR